MTTGPIAADATCYPDFLEGQVLTHNDLNLLRDFLYSRWAFQNTCLFGFGVACGLSGTAAGDLTIGKGFALGQSGRLLRLADDVQFDWTDIAGLATTESVKASDYGLTLSGGGYTALLVPDDTKQPVDETCTEQLGCTAHTDQWCEGASIVFAAGKLAISDYTTGDAFKLQPIDPKGSTTAIANAFTSLQSDLAKLLTGIVPDDTITLLKALTLDPKQPGVNLLKVGLLNEVLFTLWDYERCLFYETGACCGPGGPAAVALGFVDPAAKTWDCTYRHHFQLSTALYLAIQGYRCEDLCQRYVDHILDLIENFEPPAQPQQPNNPPPPHRCDYINFVTRRCVWWNSVEKPPQQRYPGYVAVDPTRQIPYHVDPGDPAPWEMQFGDDPYATITTVNSIDPTNSGIVRLGDYLGYDGAGSQGQLQNVITGDVQVVDVEEFSATPAVVAAASDTVVLGIDSETQTVVATGVIPTAQTLQEVPAIGADAAQAKSDAADAISLSKQSYQSAYDSAQTLSALQGDFTGLQSSWGEYQQTMNKSFTDFQQEFAGMPDIGTLKQAAQLVDNWSTIETAFQGAQSGIEVLNSKFDTQAAQLETLTQEAGTLADKQGDFAVQLEQAKSDVATQLNTATTGISSRVDQIGTRLDTQAVALSSGADVRRAGSINSTLTSALDALGAAVVKAAPQAQQAAVQQAIGQAQEFVETLRSEGSGMPVTESHPTVVANAMGAMLAAVEATGINKHTNAYRDLVHSVGELSLALGTQVTAANVNVGPAGAVGG